MIVIDSDDYNASGIETMTFPGGEPHVKVPRLSGDVALFLKLRTWAQTGFAALLIDALDKQGGVSVYPFIPYFPAARQDRSDGRAPLSLRRTGTLLQANRGVSVFDGHSDALSCYANVRHWFMPSDLALPIKPDVVGIIAPDGGAFERAADFRIRYYPHADLIECAKHRDAHTGRLSGYRMPALRRAGRYIVVDDICDGGGTFNLLSVAFRGDELSPRSQLELWVSHGIFSKGLDAVDPAFEHIYTTDSWCQLPSSGRLTVYPLAPLFSRLPERFHD